MESRHVKSINTDSRSRKRIKFASSKERSKRASADVYRSYKDRVRGGVTNAATREIFVHNATRNGERARKRQRHNVIGKSSNGSKNNHDLTAVVRVSDEKTFDNNDDSLQEINNLGGDDEGINASSTFTSELDVALDRNASEIFSKFHRQMWILVRSLPEILHNLEKVVDLLLSYIVSPVTAPEKPALFGHFAETTGEGGSGTAREEFVVNLATTDILHLLAVLARDLRHEIHPYLHTKILPRIIIGLLNPPLPPPESNRQPIPLDVAVVEASFRTLAYIFRYDSSLIANDMESMRQYYGITLGNRRELVRRLSSEIFGPLIRRMKNQNARERHIRRVLRALAVTKKQASSKVLHRTQRDAVDGISQLLFQVIRGVSGDLHSNGSRLLRFLLENLQCDGGGFQDEDGDDLVFAVVSALLRKLCQHVGDSNFTPVAQEIFLVFHDAVETFLRDQEAQPETPHQYASIESVLNQMRLIVQAFTFNSGHLFDGWSEKKLSLVSNSISALLQGNHMASLSPHSLSKMTSLLCQIWISLQVLDEPRFDTVIQAMFDTNFEDSKSIFLVSVILAKELLPFLGSTSRRIALIKMIMSSIAEKKELTAEEVLEVVFTVVSSGTGSGCRDNGKDASCFSLFGDLDTSGYKVSSEQQKTLCDACIFENPNGIDEQGAQARLSVVLRCVPFLVSLSEDIELATKAGKWIVDILSGQGNASNIAGSLIVKGLALESLSTLLNIFLKLPMPRSVVEEFLLLVKPIAQDFILSNASSLWALRGVASLMSLLDKFEIKLCDDPDTWFDRLTSNMRSSNHFLRRYTLEILTSFPLMNFVVDHADLDLSEDLDEEEGFRPPSDTTKMSKGPVGRCDLLKMLLELESAPVRLSEERSLLALIGKVEILARTGRLPAAYAEVAANHMFGMLHVKFSPLWSAAEKAIVTLATAYESTVWPCFEAELVGVMSVESKEKENCDDEAQACEFPTNKRHFHSCRKWETSNGQNVELFSSSLQFIEGEVACYHVTDSNTVMESVWKVAVLGHKIVVRHSRVIVPLFFNFLQNQYFAYQKNEQDIRELHLTTIIEEERVDRNLFRGSVLHKRLKCFLSAFAAMDGPKQLVHHNLVDRVFRSFLVHQDPSIVNLALSCLLKFKFEYLLPYEPILRDMLQKGRFRDSLLRLGEEIGGREAENEHRKHLLPFLSRVLFGKVAANSGRSSKDAPSARRAAVLSFLSNICNEDSEFFPFLYLMCRPFIPNSYELCPVEFCGADKQVKVMDALMTTCSNDLVRLHSSVIEGFLHLLEGVISQLGYRVVSWLPHFTTITLEICKLVAVKPEDRTESASKVPDCMDASKGLRRGVIRTLSIQRLNDLFSKYGSSFDFTPFSAQLWSALESSLVLLPEMAVGNDGCPAVLELLHTISTDPLLVRLLPSHDDAVLAVLKCIAGTSKSSVMDASLSFIENLLTVTDDNSMTTGKELVRKYTNDLMEQFTKRLETKKRLDLSDSSNGGSWKKSPGIRRELKILFSVSEFASDLKVDSKGVAQYPFAADLSSLLTPFLEPNQGSSDEDKMNILGVLDCITSKLSESEALLLYSELGVILGPCKRGQGIKMLTFRWAITKLIEKISEKVSRLQNISAVLVKLSSTDKKRVEELNFEEVIPALNSLAQPESGNNWKYLCSDEESQAADLLPLIQVCFHYLHSEDGVIARGAFVALKTLVLTAASLGREESDEDREQHWIKLIESVVAPLTRSGIQSHDPQIRRFYVLLVRELATSFRDYPSPNLCGDLYVLCNDENQDLDFWLNITNVQIHRRGRAFQRLRKTLSSSPTNKEAPSCHQISSQSLSNVLLPLAVHPVYESKSKSEEGFAIEGIATVGAISRHLSWSKYNALLWSMISQFDRYPDQERFMIAAICSVIDGFHFRLVEGLDGSGSVQQFSEVNKTSIWRSLEKRIIPKLEALLTKETIEKTGTKTKTIRPSIVLALTKLFQKFPEDVFESRLHGILTVVCAALRNRDSNVRDVAKMTLAKMVCTMDLKYLGDVIRELAITLNEGYKLHVRAASIHMILLEVSKVYDPPVLLAAEIDAIPSFDRCIAAIMDLIQEDLWGEPNERRESKETNVRFVKEASGAKSAHSIELICRMIVFSPTNSISGEMKSAVHCVVSPLLERLRDPAVDAKTIRRTKEILTRVAIGLSNNRSLQINQLLPFVYATVSPFMGTQVLDSIKQIDVLEENSDDGNGTKETIRVSGRKHPTLSTKLPSTRRAGVVVEWRPSLIKTSESEKSALENKKGEIQSLRKVQDGASAPKLTGSSRNGTLETFDSKAMNEPASICAIIFSLNLLGACLKKNEYGNDDESLSMLDPFVPMLTACACHCRNNEVSLSAIKCLLLILRVDLPSLQTCSKSLGSQALTFLSSANSSLNQNNEVIQACFKILTYLMGDKSVGKGDSTPLDAEQMKVLISILQVSINESDQHNPALNLIKSILSQRLMSAELYDLMESILKLVVRSQKETLRQQCAGLFVRYLLDYPMGEERFEQHLKQAIANISYEYQEGRMSGITLLTLIIEKIPQALMEKHAQWMFLPLVLQLLNDESKDCRDNVSSCLAALLKRSSTDLLLKFEDYFGRWSKQEGPLRLASLQLLCLLVECRVDFFRNSSLDKVWIPRIQHNLEFRQESQWEITYFSLVGIEKLLNYGFEEGLTQREGLWLSIVECLVDSHPWIKLSSARIVNTAFSHNLATTFLAKKDGLLFDIIRNLTIQLSVLEEEQMEELSNTAAKVLSLCLPIMKDYPEFCYRDHSISLDQRDESSHETSPSSEEEGQQDHCQQQQQQKKDPIMWLMKRLSQICKNKGSKRRIAVFKCYAAFTNNNFSIISPYMELMLEGLHRTILESKNEIENHELSQKQTTTSIVVRQQQQQENQTTSSLPIISEYTLAEDILRLMEENCISTEEFLNIYGSVKRRARDRKEQRKKIEKMEAIQNPQLHAERKMKKQQQKKQQKKRRIEEQRIEHGKGGNEKRRRRNNNDYDQLLFD